MSNVSTDKETKTASISETKPTESYNAQQTAQMIKDIARRIREESAKMAETVRVIRQSGAVEELTEAVKQASMAARDSSKDISDAARELKESGVIKDSATALDAAAKTARETAQTVGDMSRQAKDSAPQISSDVSKGMNAAKEKVRKAGEESGQSATT